MIRFSFMAIRFGQAWFDEPLNPPMPDIVILRQSKSHPASGPVSLKKSLVNDLTAPEEEIFAKFGKTCRYKIKRAESKDLAICPYHPAPSAAEVDSFLDFYTIFARQKGLKPINRKRFSAVAEAGRLRLSSAELAGAIAVRHAYITSGPYVRMLYSASLFRDSVPDARAAIGRANRLLHWRDMLAFKAEGCRFFDWGGISEDESTPVLKGINDFKREFGGDEASYFEGYAAHTLLGRAILGALSAASLAKTLLKRRR